MTIKREHPKINTFLVVALIFLSCHTYSIINVNLGPQISEQSNKIINMNVGKWTTPANMIPFTYSEDNASSHKQFSTSSLQEGFKFLYPDTPWFKQRRVKFSLCNVKVMYSPTFLIHSSPCLGYMKGLRKNNLIYWVIGCMGKTTR